VLWAAAVTRHLSLKLGPQGDTTVTVTMTPTAAQAVRAPSGAINLTGNGPVLRLLAQQILGFLAGRNARVVVGASLSMFGKFKGIIPNGCVVPAAAHPLQRVPKPEA